MKDNLKWALICGSPKSGKTTLATELAGKLNRGLVSTDTFLGFSRNYRWRALADWMKGSGADLVVEGCEATRLLPRLVLLTLPPPDRVIWVGPTDISQVEPKWRAITRMQLRHIHEGIEAGILKNEADPSEGPHVLYLPQINPRDIPPGKDD
jgi:hypothetical protein